MPTPQWLIAAVEQADDLPDPLTVDHLRHVVDRSYRNVAEEILARRGPLRCLADVRDLLALAAVRRPGSACLGIRDDPDRTVVRIVTDDMPFLVDSVTSALARERRSVRLVIHPQLLVQRDGQGRLLSVIPEGAGLAASSDIRESWMSIELEPDVVAPSHAETEQVVNEVLGDVRSAVGDWSAMRTRMLALADEVTAVGSTSRVLPTATAPVGGEPEHPEVAAFLRWLADDHLTLTGYCVYRRDLQAQGQDPPGQAPGFTPVADSRLGVLREGRGGDQACARMNLDAPATTTMDRPLIIAKASARSTVHRDVPLDVIIVHLRNAAGEVVEQHRFVGLLTGRAHSASIDQVPLLSERFGAVLATLALSPGSHSARDLQQFLQTYPRDELLQTPAGVLVNMARSALHLQERRRATLFIRLEDFRRFVSVLVYLPRDRYTTELREQVEAILLRAYSGIGLDYTVLVTDAPLARLHCIVHLPVNAEDVWDVDPQALQESVESVVRTWEDGLVDALVTAVGAAEARRLLPEYRDAFPAGYREAFAPARAAREIGVIEELRSRAADEIDLRLDLQEGSNRAQFTVTRLGPAMSLARVLPLLEHMGIEVIQERPFEITPRQGVGAYVLDFSVVLPDHAVVDRLGERFTRAFAAAWSGACEVDRFNALIVCAGLTWQEARLLRAMSRYVRQLGSPHGIEGMQQALQAQPRLARLLVELFHARSDPHRAKASGAEGDSTVALQAQIEEELVAVPSLDQDRVIRHLLSVVLATLRTNAYRPECQAGGALALKIDSSSVIGMPAPAPAVEVWVSSPRVEGVHLRRGLVARGGIRWSDRREDFRTEILGLVKAQEVKNSVIVPVGAKGGFVPLSPIDPSMDRNGWAAQGQAAYREFIAALLDITDDIVDGTIVPPLDIVRHDGPDPYLVVAADKGTATFSDLANEIAEVRGFWLGDAFASGGSHGYDHKAMGITARGAWESVRRHFLEVGLDPDTRPFTAVGIGDMSGDVFGNGMLLSEEIRLIAAFDHRHVFIDPDPDPGRSFAERRRLFNLPRSSWADYDPNAISPGGGVFERSAKSITLSAAACAALGVDVGDATTTADDLVRRVLRAPVDLLWNGGIGTYVKASTQTDAEVSDRANDAVRISADELRCQVVGEGGNLGLTQLGRVEAARRGIRLNTDAIDNSAGVDTSDHEVNLKILLDSCVRSGDLTVQDRNSVLMSVTDDVALAVLQDNYRQNVVLANGRAGSAAMASVHVRQMHALARSAGLDRAIEGLPDDEEMSLRMAAGSGLTSPELAVLLAFAKIDLTAGLVTSDLSRDPWFGSALAGYFPEAISTRFRAAIPAHPLAQRIIGTVTANRVINLGGITFVFRAGEETGATAVDVTRAATAAIEVFRIEDTWNAINALDGSVPMGAQARLHLELRRLLDRATRWFLQTRGSHIDIAEQVERFGPVVRDHAGTVAASLRGAERRRLAALTDALAEGGVPRGLAESIAISLDCFSLLDVTEISRKTRQPVDRVIDVYFAISERYDVDLTLGRITRLPREDRWTALARQALRSDLYGVVAALTLGVLQTTDPQLGTLERIAAWEAAHEAGLRRARATLDEIAGQEDVSLATLSVVLRVLRTLVAQGETSLARGLD